MIGTRQKGGGGGSVIILSLTRLKLKCLYDSALEQSTSSNKFLASYGKRK